MKTFFQTISRMIKAAFLAPFSIFMGMSVNAQLAQTTKLYIAGSAGGAKNITGIAAGFPTIITSAAHGFANGDILTVAGVTGADAASLNGVANLVVTSKTTNTFALLVDTTGKTLVATGTATPAAWTQVKEVKGIKPSGASATTIDVTDLDSTAMEFRTGLMDNGTLGIDVHILESDPGQAACLAAFAASSSNSYKVVTPAKTRTFTASCTKWPTIPDASVNGVQTGSAEFKISGDVVVS